MLLNEYEIEFMFRKIRNIRNLGNVLNRGPHIVMSRTDAQNGLDFHFKDLQFVMIELEQVKLQCASVCPNLLF
jgi:hypothetical protein